MVFIVAQLLLGCGGSPLLTLGTTYVDDHVRPESSSMYIGKQHEILYPNFLNIHDDLPSNNADSCVC